MGLSLKSIQDTFYDIQTIGFKQAVFKPIEIDTSAIDEYNYYLDTGVEAQQALAFASENTNQATIELMQLLFYHKIIK